MTRTITGTIYKFDGETPWASARLVFSLLTDTASGAAAVWPVWPKTVYAGADGTIPAGTELDTPPSGSWLYRLKIEENTPLDFYLEQGDGSDLTVADIVTLAGATGSSAGTPQQEMLLNLYTVAQTAVAGEVAEADGAGGLRFDDKFGVPSDDAAWLAAAANTVPDATNIAIQDDVDTAREYAVQAAPVPGAFFDFGTQPNANTDDIGYSITYNDNTWQEDDFIALYEAMRAANSGYITRANLGRDESDTYDIWSYTLTPEQGYEKTVLLMSGLHGGETTGVLGLWRVLYAVVNSWTSSPALAYLRHKVQLVVIPVANPWGISQVPSRTRWQSNHVNLNRNFALANWADQGSADDEDPNYRGVSAGSEAETQLIVSWMAAYPDAVAFLDYHNLGLGSSTAKAYGVLPEWGVDTNPAARTMLHLFPAALNTERDLDVTDAAATINWASYTHSFNAISPEHADGVFGSYQDADEMTAIVNWFGNLLLQYAALPAQTPSQNASQPRMWHGGYSRVAPDNLQLNAGSYAELVDLRMTFDAPGQGFLLMTGVVTVQIANATDTVFFRPKIVQVGSGNLAESKFETYFVGVGGSTQRVNVPFQVAGPVGFTNQIQVAMDAYVSANSARIYRYQCSVVWIPSGMAAPVTFLTGTVGGGGMS